MKCAHSPTACRGAERAAAGSRVHGTLERAFPRRPPLGEYWFRENRHRARTANVGPIGGGRTDSGVSAQSIAILHEAPALVEPVAVAPIAEIWAQSRATIHDEPPGLLAPTPVAQIAQVSVQSIPTVRKSPALVATKDAAQIAEVSVRSIGTVQEVSRMKVAQIGGEAAQSLTPPHERPQQLPTHALALTVKVSTQSIATVRDEPPRQLAPMSVAPISEVSTQSIVIVDGALALVAPVTACEQIWDEMTHMSRDEWAEACRRVDELRLVVRNDPVGSHSQTEP